MGFPPGSVDCFGLVVSCISLGGDPNLKMRISELLMHEVHQGVEGVDGAGTLRKKIETIEREDHDAAAQVSAPSQPALSRSLGRLERNIQSLFDRVGRRLVLNDAGRSPWSTPAQILRAERMIARRWPGPGEEEGRRGVLRRTVLYGRDCRSVPLWRLTALT